MLLHVLYRYLCSLQATNKVLLARARYGAVITRRYHYKNAALKVLVLNSSQFYFICQA